MSLVLLRFKIALRTIAKTLATTIPLAKNIWNPVGRPLKRCCCSNLPLQQSIPLQLGNCAHCVQNQHAQNLHPLNRYKTEHNQHRSPPRTGLGMICAKAPNLGRRPRRTKETSGIVDWQASLDTRQFHQANVL